MVKKLMKKLICFLMFLSCLLPVYAQGNVDMEHPVSVTVHTGVTGMEVQMYMISSMDETGELHVTDTYALYSEDLDIRGKDDSSWQEMSEVISSYITLNDIDASLSGYSDENGEVTFTGFEKGLYLIKCSKLERENTVYSSLPFFVMVPEQDMEENVWNYSVYAQVKMETGPVLTDLSVNKVWNDRGYESQRPEEITVHLYMDGNEYDSITLPYEGHWSYTWTEIEAGHEWNVTEDTLDGYRTSVRSEGNVFTITNTKMPETPRTNEIPDTGQLWWPVPILLCAGLILVIAGQIVYRSNDHA